MDVSNEGWQLDETRTLRVMLQLYSKILEAHRKRDKQQYVTRIEFLKVSQDFVDCLDRTVSHVERLTDCLDRTINHMSCLVDEVIYLKNLLEPGEGHGGSDGTPENPAV